MKVAQRLTVEKIRKMGPEAAQGPWVVLAVEKGFNVRCGESLLHSINSGKPRVFSSLDTAYRNLKDELGVTEFKVETGKERTGP